LWGNHTLDQMSPWKSDSKWAFIFEDLFVVPFF
jgi:hypothetical protein